MLLPEEANLFLGNLSGQTCDFSYENGEIVIALQPSGKLLRIEASVFKFRKYGIESSYVVGEEVPEMSELELLRKHITWFRSFAKAVSIAAKESPSKNAKANVMAVVNTYENQWPNWLDDDIERKAP